MSKCPSNTLREFKHLWNSQGPFKYPRGVHTSMSSVQMVNDIFKFLNYVLIQKIVFLRCFKRLEAFLIGYKAFFKCLQLGNSS